MIRRIGSNHGLRNRPRATPPRVCPILAYLRGQKVGFSCPDIAYLGTKRADPCPRIASFPAGGRDRWGHLSCASGESQIYLFQNLCCVVANNCTRGYLTLYRTAASQRQQASRLGVSAILRSQQSRMQHDASGAASILIAARNTLQESIPDRQNFT